jgi:hypothetical protein
MAHFAKLDENNIVLEVSVVNNEILDASNEEASGVAFLTVWSGGHTNWKQTSYNTHCNQHKNNGTPFRGNYASVGFTYDPDFDIFIPPKKYPSWKFNYTTCQWEPPILMPEEINGYMLKWSEPNQEWIQIAIPQD